MSEFFIVLAAVWGASGALVVIIFALDERRHRRTGSAVPLRDVTVHPTDAATRAKVPTHGDRALA